VRAGGGGGAGLRAPVRGRLRAAPTAARTTAPQINSRKNPCSNIVFKRLGLLFEIVSFRYSVNMLVLCSLHLKSSTDDENRTHV
jgi:hypothetical protein